MRKVIENFEEEEKAMLAHFEIADILII